MPCGPKWCEIDHRACKLKCGRARRTKIVQTHIEPDCNREALEAENEGDVRHHDPVTRTGNQAGGDANAVGLAVAQQAKTPHHFPDVLLLESEITNTARRRPVREAGHGHVEVLRMSALIPRHAGSGEAVGSDDEEGGVGDGPCGPPAGSSRARDANPDEFQSDVVDDSDHAHVPQILAHTRLVQVPLRVRPGPPRHDLM